jgi:hypothetical protein
MGQYTCTAHYPHDYVVFFVIFDINFTFPAGKVEDVKFPAEDGRLMLQAR